MEAIGASWKIFSKIIALGLLHLLLLPPFCCWCCCPCCCCCCCCPLLWGLCNWTCCSPFAILLCLLLLLKYCCRCCCCRCYCWYRSCCRIPLSLQLSLPLSLQLSLPLSLQLSLPGCHLVDVMLTRTHGYWCWGWEVVTGTEYLFSITMAARKFQSFSPRVTEEPRNRPYGCAPERM